MKKTGKIILGGLLAISVTTGALAFGSHYYYSNMTTQEKTSMMSRHFGDKLDLSDYQQTQLDMLADGMADVYLQARASQPDHKQMMVQMLDAQSLDQTALLQKIQQKTAIVNEKAPEMVALLAGFVDTLDESQKQTLKGMMNKRHQSRHGSFQSHGGHQHDWK